MRITFVLPALGMSGGFRIVAHYADCLRRRGHEVTLVATAIKDYHPEPRPKLAVKALLGKPSWWQQQASSNRFKAAWHGLTVGKPPYTAGPSHFDQFPDLKIKTLPYARPVTDRDLPDADVVIATWWETAPAVLALSPSKGVKVNFIQQNEANFDQPADQVDATWRLPMHKIVCARWLADLARDRFGDEQVTIAPNGVDTDLFDAPPRGKQARPTVGVMYSVYAPKAWPTALEVLRVVARRVPDLRMILFGMMSPTTSLPIPDGAEFELLPTQARIRDIYAQCDAWLCTSSSEGFHLPPHEAMACRTPVVSTRVGGPMDIIVDAQNGYLADPFDVVTLADRLTEVLTFSEDRWRMMSDAAYHEARSHTWDMAADRFEAGLQVAIERTARGDFGGHAQPGPARDPVVSGVGGPG